MMHRALLIALATALLMGCASGAPPRLPPTAPQAAHEPAAAITWVGSYPQRFRDVVTRQLATFPTALRRHPPRFGLVKDLAAMKALNENLRRQEDVSGAYDPATRTVWGRLDQFGLHDWYVGHEISHDLYFSGADPRQPHPKFMTREQRLDFDRWNWDRFDTFAGQRLIPQYSWELVPSGMRTPPKVQADRKWSHETWAVLGNQVLYPGGRHPRYSRANPVAAAKFRGYFSPW